MGFREDDDVDQVIVEEPGQQRQSAFLAAFG
jgi:hypothetical protein